MKELLRTTNPVGGEVCIFGETSLSEDEECPLSTMVAARERTSSGDSGITSELAISITYNRRGIKNLVNYRRPSYTLENLRKCGLVK